MRTSPDQRDRRVATDVEVRLTALSEMDNGGLRKEWRRLYGYEPPPRASRKLLMLVVAYRIQERALGGLSAAMLRRLRTLGDTIQSQGTAALSRATQLQPGTRLIREWHGETHIVLVHEDGFEWRETRWRSLSAIARAITGARWSGPRFFGLIKSPVEQPSLPEREADNGR